MTFISEFISECRDQGIKLWLDGGKLKYGVAQGKLPDAIRAELVSRKEEVIAYLSSLAGLGERQEDRIGKADRSKPIRLSFAQEGLWFIDQLQSSSNYHISTVLRIDGELDVPKLNQAYQQLLQRHEILRSTYLEEDGVPYMVPQVVDGQEIKLEKPDPTQEWDAQVRSFIDAPFDLERDLMFRIHLLPLPAGEQRSCLLALVMHHIASDGFSNDIVVRELIEIYRAFVAGEMPQLEELPLQYADFAAWQRLHLEDGVLKQQLTYWQDKLADTPPLNLPFDFSRSKVSSLAGETLRIELSPTVGDKVLQLSAQAGGTPFTFLLATFKLLLFRYAGQREICVGSPITHRTSQETQALVGYFVNTVALRTDLHAEMSFSSLFEAVKQTFQEAFAHQDAPFEKVVESLDSDRDLGRNVLFQVFFSLENEAPVPELTSSTVQITHHPLDFGTSKFDLSFHFQVHESGIRLLLEYSTELFEKTTVQRIGSHFEHLLSAVVQAPETPIGQLEMLSAAERKQLISDFNPAPTPIEGANSVLDLFDVALQQNPQGIALRHGNNQQLSYADLHTKVNRLAHHLQEMGIGQGDHVGLFVERGPEMVIGLLASLLAGAAYVPLDPSMRAQRLEFAIADAALKMVLVQPKLLVDLPFADYEIVFLDEEVMQPDWLANRPSTAPQTQVLPAQAAYIIYTSGSTGQPKGCLVSHDNLLNYVHWANEHYFLQPEAGNFPLFTPLTFDLTLTSIFCSLTKGRTLTILPPELPADQLLRNCFHPESGINAIKLTPAHLTMLGDLGIEATGIETVIVGGEQLLPAQVANLRAVSNNINLFNEYGPTEATVGCVVTKIEGDGPILIGKPIANVQAYVLDDNLQPLPLGVAGELCLSGRGIAMGYQNRPQLTREKFLDNPFSPGNRMYRTGDVVRWLPNGQLEYLGRSDEQVKIRGYRIEPGEIETVLSSHPNVAQALVMARKGPNEELKLVAYFVPQPQVDTSELRTYLSERLPAYMLPGHLVEMEAFPLTQNGKVNRKAFPNPEAQELLSDAYLAPRNPVEEQLAEIWQELLGLERVGVNDNFFELGGHSLLAVRLMGKMAEEFQLSPALSVLFSKPTIALLAELVEVHPEEDEERILISVNQGGSRAPLFCAPGAGGNVISFYTLGQEMEGERKVYGFQAYGASGKVEPLETVEEMAAANIREMRKVQPKGPYFLAGYSFGGKVAYEMAVQLLEAGAQVGGLVVFDTTAPTKSPENASPAPSSTYIEYLGEIVEMVEAYYGKSIDLSPAELEQGQIQALHTHMKAAGIEITLQQLTGFAEVYIANHRCTYHPPMEQMLKVPLILFRTPKAHSEELEAGDYLGRHDLGWGEVTNEVMVYELEVDHLALFQQPQVAEIAQAIELQMEYAFI